jgi:hypothetical protein
MLTLQDRPWRGGAGRQRRRERWSWYCNLPDTELEIGGEPEAVGAGDGERRRQGWSKKMQLLVGVGLGPISTEDVM